MTIQDKETYVQVLQLIAIQQIQIDLIDDLIEKKILRMQTKYLAKSFLDNILKFQNEFFGNDLEILTENDKLLKFLDEELKKVIGCIEVEIKDKK